MKEFKVTIKEELIYEIEVFANTPEEAEEKAFESEKFKHNLHTKNDSWVEDTEEIGEVEEETEE